MESYIYKRRDGGTTFCYGVVEFGSNFEIVADDESFDGIFTDYEGELNWRAVCRYLEKNYYSKIEQLEAI